MWRVEKRKRIGIKPWSWMFAHSAYGAAGGEAWTKRGAEKALVRAQNWFFAEDHR